MSEPKDPVRERMLLDHVKSLSTEEVSRRMAEQDYNPTEPIDPRLTRWVAQTVEQWHPTMQPERIREDQEEQRAEAGKATVYETVEESIDGETWVQLCPSPPDGCIRERVSKVTPGEVHRYRRYVMWRDEGAQRPVPIPSPSSPNQDTPQLNPTSATTATVHQIKPIYHEGLVEGSVADWQWRAQYWNTQHSRLRAQLLELLRK